MKKRNLWISRAFLLALPLASVSHRAAQADVYHSVETGDTLSSISSKYRVSADVLRVVNKLSIYSDRDTLPPMLLRVPESSSAKATGIVTARSQASASISPSFADAQTRGASNRLNATTSSTRSSSTRETASPASSQVASGRVSKSFLYVVQAGDTVESIAQRHTEYGYPVTAQAIRNKNDGATTLTPGRTVIVPVGTVNLTSAVNEASTLRAPSLRSSSLRTVATDDEALPASQNSQAPLYESIRTTPRPQATRRGPTALGSRGYTPSSNYDRGGNRLDGAQLLDPSRDANVTGTPLGRMRSRTVAPRPTASAVNPTAQVARIALAGARIRRLPDASATTLYKCSTGTEIAVTKRSGEWSAILMSDRSTGWVPTRYLKFTGQSVDISTQIVAATSGSSANYSVRSADGRWSSTNPMVAQALSWMGTPYVYGGTSRRGIDCSAMIQNSFRACGYRLPRTAAQQARVGTPIAPSDLQPGDRLYFSASGTRVDHTGLYMGNGLFVHASGSGRSVIVSKLFDRRNWNIYTGARR